MTLDGISMLELNERAVESAEQDQGAYTYARCSCSTLFTKQINGPEWQDKE